MTTTVPFPIPNRLASLDLVGSVLSTLCAIHCLAMPLVAGLLPVLGLNFLGDRAFERAACVAMTALAAFCLLQGCQRHRRWWLLGLLGAGASLTLGTQFFFATNTDAACAKSCCSEGVNWSQALVMFTGGGLIAASHLLNLRFGRACGCCANVPQTLAGSDGVRAGTSRGIPRRRTGLSLLRHFPLLLAACVSAQAFGAHSDIIISRSNGVLRVDATVHTSDVRENDAAGNGTVWATDNPGFAGSGFVFQDEFLFDITGPLRRWDGTNWSTANVGPEFMEFVEPGPFGDPIHSVTITRATTFATGYQITEARDARHDSHSFHFHPAHDEWRRAGRPATYETEPSHPIRHRRATPMLGGNELFRSECKAGLLVRLWPEHAPHFQNFDLTDPSPIQPQQNS